MIKKLTACVLLALSFGAAADNVAAPGTVAVGTAGTTADHVRAPVLEQTVAVIHFKADAADVGRILADVEKQGFTTATANLALPDAGKNNAVLVFSGNKNGGKLTSPVVTASVSKHAKLELSASQVLMMPDRAVFRRDDTTLSVINDAKRQDEDGRVTLTQFVSASVHGKETAFFNTLTMNKDGAIISILRPTAGDYYLTLSTLN